MPKPAKKKTKVLAHAKKIGELEAERTFNAKWTKNRVKAFIIERLTKAIDKIDPLKLFAIVGTTYFIKQGIEWTEEMTAVVQKYGKTTTPFSFSWVTAHVWDLLGVTERPKDLAPEEVIQWGLSFVVAYIIIEHGGELLIAGGNLLGAAKGLIGMFGA